jgi:dynein heavy chain
MYASKFDSAVQLFKRINFSSATSPSLFQASIETECDNKIGKDFAPPQNKKMVVFVDDMSMPFVNKWGDQITLEIVRQLIEQGGFYWLEKSQRGMFKNIRNLSFIGAMNHPGGGRNDIPNRLKRQFFIFNMILPLSIEGIYGPIIRHQFKVDAKNSGLNEEVKKVIENLTSATIKLWELVKKYMLPTPAKFHYVFNMREISRVFKGILQIKREAIMRTERVKDIKPEVYTVGLWRHECERVFCDKLINSKDKDTVLNYIHDISLDSFEGLQADINEKFARDKIFLFCDFLIPDVKDEDGVIIQAALREYEAVNDIEWLRKRCYECIEDYNAEPKNTRKLDLVLFDDAVKHLLRISRIIKMPRSSALLVGVGGSGKQSLTRLAASIGKMEMRQIELVKNYGDKDLREDLKKYFEITGRFGRPCCFMLTDS